MAEKLARGDVAEKLARGDKARDYRYEHLAILLAAEDVASRVGRSTRSSATSRKRLRTCSRRFGHSTSTTSACCCTSRARPVPPKSATRRP